MPIDLAHALSWTKADADGLAMMSDLQANILKGHGRRCSRHLLIKFHSPEAGIHFIHAIAPLLTSALEQLRQTERFKALKVSGGPVLCAYLSAKGYRFMNREGKMPHVADGDAFSDGLAKRSLGDDPATVEDAYREDIHLKLLLAGDPDSPTSWTSEIVDHLETKILNMLSEAGGGSGDGGKVVASEIGRAIFNAQDDGLEHFGYVDGRSQPLLLTEDVAAEQAKSGIDKWDPTFPLKQVLVKDPGSPDAHAFGSYFVMRKLEQDVAAFNEAEEALGEALGNGEQAGAMIVGRFEDGTPIVLQDDDGLHDPVTNNFTYAADPDGSRCPIHAHIRKTNPRGDSMKLGASMEQERSHIMARRGIPYGRRNQISQPSDMPTKGVGLLFMAYQSNLATQFEFTQTSWVNNPDFTKPGTGMDPIISQSGPFMLNNPRKWGDAAAGTMAKDFGGFVTFRGGEYFFAPAISTLRHL